MLVRHKIGDRKTAAQSRNQRGILFLPQHGEADGFIVFVPVGEADAVVVVAGIHHADGNPHADGIGLNDFLEQLLAGLKDFLPGGAFDLAAAPGLRTPASGEELLPEKQFGQFPDGQGESGLAVQESFFCEDVGPILEQGIGLDVLAVEGTGFLIQEFLIPSLFLGFKSVPVGGTA